MKPCQRPGLCGAARVEEAGGSPEHSDDGQCDLLASIKTRLAELDRFWEKEQTKADVDVFILDEVFASLPSPPFTPDEKKTLAASVYA